MAKTFTISSANRLLPGPEGVGGKVVQGHLSLGPASEAVHHSDVRLNTIKALFIEQNAIGSYIVVTVSGPGTYDNYASLAAYNLDGTGGYLVARSAGTFAGRFMAIGE